MTAKARIYNEESLMDLGIKLETIKKDLIKGCLAEININKAHMTFSVVFKHGKNSDARTFIECELKVIDL